MQSIDLNKITPYPLQFANCERIERNDAVYIFDEVGCGKTISAGLMALHYLNQHKDKSVLVITVNALVVTNQFADDWLEKLPFIQNGFSGRFTVINNHYSNLEKAAGKQYGMIIIDEAHLFLNRETKRHQALVKLQAEKVVFLTATPTKYFYRYNMGRYADIADSITQKPLSREWIERISTQGKPAQEIICQTFSLDAPVTRYFKDTVKALEVADKNFAREKARRLIPDIWDYSGETEKFEEISGHIQREISKYIQEAAENTTSEPEPEPRFVVFVRYVNDAQKMGEALEAKGFHQGSGGKNSYKIVTGKSEDLKPFQRKDVPLPTVLIITYQLAEQGVNLPGYSHVVNVHIPANPSALEQRFGRIDRMDSNYKEIKMHFCLLKNDNNYTYYSDTSSTNFSCAVWTYLVNLISYLPAKNTLLTKDILARCEHIRENTSNYLEGVKNALQAWGPQSSDEDRKLLEQFYQDFIESRNSSKAGGGEQDSGDTRDIEFWANKEFWEDDVEDKITELQQELELNRKINSETTAKIISDQTQDKIFYFPGSGEKTGADWFSEDAVAQKMKTLDAIRDCAAGIRENGAYISYRQKFESEIKPLIIFYNYQDELEKRYEALFRENKIERIFDEEETRRFLHRSDFFDPKVIRDIGVFLNFASAQDMCRQIAGVEGDNLFQAFKNKKYWRRLPFFQMCDAFLDSLKSVALNGNELKRSYKTNKFQEAFYELGSRIPKACRGGEPNPFYIEDDGKGHCIASNWLRLAVQLSQVESVKWWSGGMCFGGRDSLLDGLLYTQSGSRREIPLYRAKQNCPPKSSAKDWWTKQL